MSQHNLINYIEIPVKDMEKSKDFFARAFGWSFVDYGPDYAAISDAGIDAGIFVSDKTMSTESGSALIVLFSDDLEASRSHILAIGGGIVQDIFSFPGGRRFHFSDLNGNEYAIWGNEPDG